jgi:hypothetical protein
MSLARKRKKHKGKTPEEQCKTWKWVRAKRGLTRKLPYHVPTKEGMIDKVLEEEWWLKYKRTWRPKKEWTKRKSWDNCTPAPPPPLVAQSFSKMALCYNPNLGLTTKARACEGADQVRNPKVTFHGPKSARKCEGVNPHTPKWTPTLGVGVLVDF